MTRGFSSRRSGITATFDKAEVAVLRGLLGELLELLRGDEQKPSPPSEPTEPTAGSPAPRDSEEAQDFADDPFAAIVRHLGGTDDDKPEPPSDEVLKRLLPNAYVDDEDAAAEFRRFTEQGLRDGKVTNAETVLGSLGEPNRKGEVTVTLDRGEAEAWLRTLTDLRLAIGTRLGVDQDDDVRWAMLDDDSYAKQVYGVYLWLGYVQESLVHALF